MLARHVSDLTGPSSGAFYKLYLKIWYVVLLCVLLLTGLSGWKNQKPRVFICSLFNAATSDSDETASNGGKGCVRRRLCVKLRYSPPIWRVGAPSESQIMLLPNILQANCCLCALLDEIKVKVLNIFSFQFVRAGIFGYILNTIIPELYVVFFSFNVTSHHFIHFINILYFNEKSMNGFLQLLM